MLFGQWRNNVFESVEIWGGEIRKDFAIEFYMVDFEKVDKPGVLGRVVDLWESSVDPLNPEFSKIAFFEPSAFVGVLAGMKVCFFADFV